MKLKAWLSKNKAAFRANDLSFIFKTIFKQNILFLQELVLTPAQAKCLEKVKREYRQGIPLAYSLGKEEFYGLEFKINKNVLVPRPETEILVEKALEIVAGAGHDQPVKVLDLCCGSGAIAVAVKKFSKQKVVVTATDLSEKALSLARDNARLNKVAIKFLHGDLFTPLKNKKFDLIVSNPPYVAGKDIHGTLLYEPRLALYAADDGLAIIKKIITQAQGFLKPRATLMIEVGFNQRKAIDKFLTGVSFYTKPFWCKDYLGHDRVVCLQEKYSLQQNYSAL